MFQHRADAVVRSLTQSRRSTLFSPQAVVLALIVAVSAALMVVTAANIQ
jgi:hypothetical protein